MTITVNYTPSSYELVFGEFVCTHENTYNDTLEHHDHYMEAVTGLPQPVSYEPVEVCEQCNAYYSIWGEEWHEDEC